MRLVSGLVVLPDAPGSLLDLSNPRDPLALWDCCWSEGVTREDASVLEMTLDWPLVGAWPELLGLAGAGLLAADRDNVTPWAEENAWYVVLISS